ncbi:MAG: YkgJ family cysteine cluster protein [Nitrospirota bacterium]|nr:YkgJ family cysteine cluster protein [Nitrospirota bacterium]
MKTPSGKSSSGLSRRQHFPGDEQRLSWLPALLDSYAIIDTGVAVAVRDREKKRKQKLACSPGCDVCCHQPDIPLYPHELPGLRWYIFEKLDKAARSTVLRRCSDHRRNDPCPFLVDRACSVHAVRPIACRQYNVFAAACAPGEDPYYSRRDDVLVPIPDYTDRAFAAVRSFYELEKEKDVAKAVKRIKERIMNLQEQDWSELGKDFERLSKNGG